jgi:[phosphatase 2A protein]-leucine-carboxy methyltransferase
VTTIARNRELADIINLTNSEVTETEIHGKNYHLHAVDLRNIKCNDPLLRGMDPTKDTLVVSECCLCYLEPADSENVLKWVLNCLSACAVVLYEPIGRDDSFGRTMIQNLAMRGISLPSLQKLPTVEAQVDRLLRLGFTSSHGADMAYVHDTWITDEDRHRVNSLEFLDEVEEMYLLFSHYCVVWASTLAAFSPEWSRTRANNKNPDNFP